MAKAKVLGEDITLLLKMRCFIILLFVECDKVSISFDRLARGDNICLINEWGV